MFVCDTGVNLVDLVLVQRATPGGAPHLFIRPTHPVQTRQMVRRKPKGLLFHLGGHHESNFCLGRMGPLGAFGLSSSSTLRPLNMGCPRTPIRPGDMNENLPLTNALLATRGVLVGAMSKLYEPRDKSRKSQTKN